MKLIKIEPQESDSERQERRAELLTLLNTQKGFTKEMYRENAIALGLCVRCGEGDGYGKINMCNDCRADMES